jgi:hypothetical protein
MTVQVIPLASMIPMDTHGTYVHWGVIQISAANLVVIALMLILFAIALLAPFPGRKK